ncbi:MAG: sigma-54 dependent transcriptional regulator [Cyclobacteriaceae bacterium]
MASKAGNILVVDDDKDVLYTAKLVLKPIFEKVVLVEDPVTIPELFSRIRFDVVILDMNFQQGVTSGKEGLEWLEKIIGLDDGCHVIMNTAYGDIQLAVDAMKLGAIDFIVKPWEKEKLLATVNTVYNLSKEKRKVRQLQGVESVLSQDINKPFASIVSESSIMQNVFRTIEKVAQTDADVLILGENGTGKELIAREIHRQSQRKKKPLIKVDLGSIAETLFESELFGHKKGSFTDAKEDRVGRFEVASGGSLFLDEIGNLSLQMQSKLLTVLQSRQVVPVGSNQPVPIDIRLISATNKPIYEMSDNQEFRTDLLYRINTVEIQLPPLRERVGDISVLARHFLKNYADKYDKHSLRLDARGIKKLEGYSWPGNVRELQHTIERAVILNSDGKLTPDDFLLKPDRKKAQQKSSSFKIEDMEKDAITNAIDKWDGNLTLAAKELGWGRSTLYRKMEKYGI